MRCLQALPIFLDKLVDPVTAVVLSVSVVLVIGAVLPGSSSSSSSIGACECSGAVCQPCAGHRCAIDQPPSMIVCRQLHSSLHGHPCCAAFCIRAAAGQLPPQHMTSLPLTAALWCVACRRDPAAGGVPQLWAPSRQLQCAAGALSDGPERPDQLAHQQAAGLDFRSGALGEQECVRACS